MYKISNRSCPPTLYQICCKRFKSRNHYDSLQITPASSPADVKKAYYKLSLKYHPDVGSGTEDKFREITAAYEVLGNTKLRKLYDQGVLGQKYNRDVSSSSSDAETPTSDPNSRFYRSKAPATGRTQFYNYDEWSKMHYQKTLHKEFDIKTKRATQRTHAENKALGEEEGVLLRLVFFAFIIAGILGFSSSSTMSRDRDRPRMRPND